MIQLLQVGKIYKQYSKSQSLLEMDEKVEKLRSYSLTLANLEAMGNLEASPKKGGETPKPLRQMRRAVKQVIAKPRFSKIVRAKLEEEKDRIASEISPERWQIFFPMKPKVFLNFTENDQKFQIENQAFFKLSMTTKICSFQHHPKNPIPMIICHF